MLSPCSPPKPCRRIYGPASLARRADLEGLLTRHGAGERLERHRHADAYIAITISGSYFEAGDDGRVRASPGTVIVHDAHSAHRDNFGARGAIVLNLPALNGLTGAGTIADADAVAKAAERDLREAVSLVAEQFQPALLSPGDWPDLLARDLARNPDLQISNWADSAGLDPASVSRGFAKAFGVTPKRYRLEARARRAIAALNSWQGSLATIAAEQGFADQSHFTRTVRDLTGATPQLLKAKSVQSGTRCCR